MAGTLSKLLVSAASALDRRFGWDRLPRLLGVPTLVGLRIRLREENLYDTGPGGAKPAADGGPRDARTADGSYNDLESPAMGMIGARFGRNVPLAGTHPEPICRACSTPIRASSAAACSPATSSSRPRS